MKRLAVIGWPVKHSISPTIQRAALQKLGIDASYDREEVSPEDLPSFVAALRSGAWLGINVTIPHKETIIPLLDRLSPGAAAIGAVNTVVVDEGRLSGHNTDAAGFIESLRGQGSHSPAGERVALLGAGGAARAVLWSLVEGGAGRVTLFNRHRERAESLAAAARSWRGETELFVEPWTEDALARTVPECSLVVNATSVGLSAGDTPIAGGLVERHALVVDLIYNPRPTRLLREARARGARTLDGLPMLVYQGAAAFELWTGKAAPVQEMLAAAETALAESAARDGRNHEDTKDTKTHEDSI